MSDFAGLRIGLSALYAQRRGLEITGHNVANSNTDGYTRQRVDLENIGPPATGSMWSRVMGSGQGVRIADVVRYRDQFLEMRAALEHGSEEHLGTVEGFLNRVESYFAEPSDIGIGNRLSEFWAGWDDIANHPADVASRTQLLERANTLSAAFNHASATLTGMRSDAISQLDVTVSRVNELASSVAAMNERIKAVLTAGLNANDLLDQRDQLVGELAETTGATVRYGEFGEANVFIGGTGLVLGSSVHTLRIETSGPTVSVLWADTAYPAAVGGGQAGGLLEVINSTLPGQLTRLDTVANSLRDSVNALHAHVGGRIDPTARDLTSAGTLTFDLALDGGAFSSVSIAGADFSGAGGAAALQAALQASIDGSIGAGNATVTVTGGAGEPLEVSVVPTTGHAIQVRANGTNSGLATLLGATAIGSDGIGGRDFFTGTGSGTIGVSSLIGGIGSISAGTASGGALGNSIALDLAELGDASVGADADFRRFITTLGVDTQNAQHRLSMQAAAVTQVDNARSSMSGVNVDEEMVNMVQYQHAYDAAARFITSIDQMLDTLINGTGVVGR